MENNLLTELNNSVETEVIKRLEINLNDYINIDTVEQSEVIDNMFTREDTDTMKCSNIHYSMYDLSDTLDNLQNNDYKDTLTKEQVADLIKIISTVKKMFERNLITQVAIGV